MTLIGIGAMASPRYRPAGLLVEYAGARVMIDGGPRAAASGPLDDWLVSDTRGELIAAIRGLAKRRGVEPGVRAFKRNGLSITPRRVVHTSHPAFGYLIRAPREDKAARVRARRPADDPCSRARPGAAVRRARKGETGLLNEVAANASGAK